MPYYELSKWPSYNPLWFCYWNSPKAMSDLLCMLNLIAMFLLFHKNVLTFHLILMIVYFHWHVYELQSLLSFEYPNDLVSNLMSYPMSSDCHYLGLCVLVPLLFVCYLLWLAICGHNLYTLVLLIPGNQTNFSVFVQVSVSHKGLTHSHRVCLTEFLVSD